MAPGTRRHCYACYFDPVAHPEVWTKGDIFQRFGTTWDSLHYGLTQQPKAQVSLVDGNIESFLLFDRALNIFKHDFVGFLGFPGLMTQKRDFKNGEELTLSQKLVSCQNQKFQTKRVHTFEWNSIGLVILICHIIQNDIG